jgi:DNA (cytosine-5)-methyltransferase 1
VGADHHRGAGNVWEGTPGMRAKPITAPLPVQTTTAQSALAQPPGFLFQTAHGGRVSDLGAPHPTVCASDDRQALVIPLRRNGHAQSVDGPVPTVVAGGTHHGLLMRNNKGGAEMVTPVDEPARTLTSAGHQSLLMPYYGNGQAQPVERPVPTIPTRDRFALVDLESIIDDCGFRMLEPHEIAAAMAFPAGYIADTYTKKDRVKLAGNAVTPPVMAWITGRVLQALEGAA